MKTEENSTKFHPNKFYHIYNRGNNSQLIFFEKQNYKYFLKRFYYYLLDYIDIYAYALLPNHFHFLIKVKDETDADEVSFQFRKFFISYSKAINKQQGRTGSLFQKNFKRKLIENEKYLYQLILYIHANPQKHKYVDDFKSYDYSSYHDIVNNTINELKIEEIVDWFGSTEKLIMFHDENKYIYSELNLIEGEN